MTSNEPILTVAHEHRPPGSKFWTCDVCIVREFDTFEEAAEHEKTCTGPPPLAAAPAAAASGEAGGAGNAINLTLDDSSDKGDSNSRDTCSDVVEVTAATGGDQGQQQQRQQQQQQMPPPPPRIPATPPPPAAANGNNAVEGNDTSQNPELKEGVLYTTVWTCDICRAEEFLTFQEAVDHEQICVGGGGQRRGERVLRTPMGPRMASAVSGIATYGENDDKNIRHTFPPSTTYWSCDMCNLWHFSSYDAAIEHEKVCEGNPAAPVRSIITRSKTGNGPPSSPVGDASQLTMREFPAMEEAAKPVPAEPSAARPLVDGPSAPNRQQQQQPAAPLAPPQGTNDGTAASVVIPPGTVFPLMHEDFSTDEETLNLLSRTMLALDQMVFVVSNDGTSDPPSHSSATRVSLSCKHCKKTWTVESLHKLHEVVTTVMQRHLPSSCAATPADVVSLMKKLVNSKSRRKKRGSQWTTVRDYCHYLVGKYGLFDVPGKSSTNSSDGIAAPPSIGIGPSSVAFAVKMAETAAESAVNERKRALMQDDEEDRKRSLDSEADVQVIETRKRRKISSQKDHEPEKKMAMLHEDDDGNVCCIPPAGGVPLVSSQSATMYSRLSRYYQLAIDNLELYEEGESAQAKLVRLRCQNCKSNPQLMTSKNLSNVTSWYKAVKKMASSHVPFCPCLAPSIREELESYQKVKKDPPSLVAYCHYLTSLYSMKDSNNGVIWCECKPFESEYRGCPREPSQASPPRTIPRHILMMPPPETASMPPTRTGMVLSDFCYLQASQCKFVLVKRKGPAGSRKRATSRSPSPSCLDLTLALKCQYCKYTKVLDSIGDFASSFAYLVNLHQQQCRPEECAAHLDELKGAKLAQENDSAKCTTVPKYAKEVMTNVYGMVDLEWNGVSGGVGFAGDIEDDLKCLHKKYGRGHQDQPHGVSWESFALPLLLEDMVDPFTAGLTTELASARNENSEDSQKDQKKTKEAMTPGEGNKENTTLTSMTIATAEV